MANTSDRSEASWNTHRVLCESTRCPCFEQGFEDGYRQKEREMRLGLPSVLPKRKPSRPKGMHWVAHVLASGGFCLIKCPHFGPSITRSDSDA